MDNVTDQAKTSDALAASMAATVGLVDVGRPIGVLDFECHDADGNEIWCERVYNIIPTLGKNLILDEAYAGVSYSATEYMGLINSGATLAVGDTMSSHAGWTEITNSGTPNVGTTRPTLTWNAASGGSKVANAATFVATGTGTLTIGGAFVVGGSGASATIGNTGGVLMNEGTLATGQPVISGNTVTIAQSVTLT